MSRMTKREKFERLAGWLAGQNCSELVRVYGQVTNVTAWRPDDRVRTSSTGVFRRGIRLVKFKNGSSVWLIHRPEDEFRRGDPTEMLLLVKVAMTYDHFEGGLNIRDVQVLAGPGDFPVETLELLERKRAFPLQQVIDNIRGYMHSQAMYHQNAASELFELKGTFREELPPEKKGDQPG